MANLYSSELEAELEQELHELHEGELEGEGEAGLEGEGILGTIGNMLGGLLGEGEGESHEAAHEAAHEIAHHEIAQHEALAEMMAEAAAQEAHEGEAEAMAGAATMTVISPADRRALRTILPHLVRGTAILTRVLRRRRATRVAVRAIPTVMRRTIKTLKRQAAAGKPITRRTAARAAASQVRQVIGNPTVCAAAIARNVKSSRAVRPARRAVRSVAG